MHILHAGNKRKGVAKCSRVVRFAADSCCLACTVRPYPFDIRIRQPGITGMARLSNGKWLREHRDTCEGSVESNSSSCIPDHTNEAPFPVSTGYPSVFFLDVNVFKRRRLKAPMPQMAIQDNIFKEIGNDPDIQATVGAYFFSTATWMSIVSKKQLHQEISAFPIEMAPDVLPLIL